MKTRRFILDLHPEDQRPPQRGDILLTATTANRVIAARPVESRTWDNRWHVTLERLGTLTAQQRRDRQPGDYQPVLGGRTFHTSSYQRGEGPADYFANRELTPA